jgi:CDP-diacylglycerol--glycerol-3-phosphate 3-phosphatidyltransferase
MNPATIMTTSRLVWAPVFAYCFIASAKNDFAVQPLWTALFFAVLIELSDAFDGMLARQRKEVTDFGKIFDPVCDSLSRQTVFLAFLLTEIIPLWMFLVFLYRDSLMSFLRVMCAADGTVVAARKSGKLKAVFQAAATFLIIGILLLRSYGFVSIPESLWGRHIGFWIMLPVAGFTFLSFFDYLVPHRNVFKRRMAPTQK